MIGLTQLLKNEDQRATKKNKSSGEVLEPMSAQQAILLAKNILVNGIAPSQMNSLDLLSVGGVMTAEQLGVTPRALRDRRGDRVIDRLPHTPTAVEEKFLQYGLPVPEDKTRLQLYTLGPVGAEIAKMRYDIEPPHGYLAYTLERIMHDVVVNELMIRIGKLAIEHGWHMDWISEREATLYQDHRQVLKPDALICLKQDDIRYLYALEYHNEQRSTRAVKKIRRYERAYSSNLWQEAWEVDEFPPILAAFRAPIVGHGYREGVQDRDNVNCTYYGMSLASLLKKPGTFYNFNSGEKESVWPWSK